VSAAVGLREDKIMTSNITILTEKLENLPEDSREKIAKYISEHFEEFEDEMLWDEQFQNTSSKLIEMARNARKEFAEGKSEPMDFEKL
jgi:uncharacterized membrane protein